MKKFFCYLLIIGFTIIGNVHAQVQQAVSSTPQLIEKIESNGNNLIIPYEKWKLPNDLTVIIHEDHSDPLVNIQVTYHVGSAREVIGKSGFAHFFEHMMFQGSAHVNDEEHFKIINEAGGDGNGFTQRDLTVYYETVPSNQLEVALWLESDRMGFLLDSLTSKKFENQRDAVKNEKSQNFENQPYVMAFAEIKNQTLYPSGHPYSWPVIGYVDDLNRANLQDVKDFFARWYGPNNATLVISGDVNPKQALSWTEKYFGSLNRGPEVRKQRIPVPILANDVYASYRDNVYLPLTLMTYPTVPMYHKDEPALNILADVMGGGNNSVFYKNFVKPEKAIQVGVSHGSSELAGEFDIMIFAYPEYAPNEINKQFDELDKKIRETIDEFEKTGITDEAIQRAKAKIESNYTSSVLNSVLEKGMILAKWNIFPGKTINLTDEIDRYNRVTKEDVIWVFNKYIKSKYAAIVNVYPKDPASKDSVKSVNPYANVNTANNEVKLYGEGESEWVYKRPQDNFDRSRKPSPSPSKIPLVTDYYTSQLKNGLKIIGTQTSESPMVSLFIEMEGGELFADDIKKIGVADLTSSMMNEGTQNYTTEQISAEIEKLGSSISFSSDKYTTNVQVESLTKNLDATLKLLEEMLYRPRFDAADFKRVKKQSIEMLAHERRVADAAASKLFNNLVYENSVLGTYLTPKGLDKVTLEDVKAYYQKYYSPSVSNLVIVGDISEKEILPKLDFLNKWEAKEVKLPDFSNLPAKQQTQVYLADKAFAPQSVITMGHLGPVYDATGDYFRATVMNYPFGAASLNSRLNLNLRENKGYTYGIYSYFTGNKYPGKFEISASVRANATGDAIKEIMKEINKYLNEGIQEQELNFTKNSLLNRDALKYESPFQKAVFLSQIVTYNLPKDYISQQASILDKISKDEINQLAKTYIDPNKMVILVVGDKYVLKKQLEDLGYGKIKEISLE